MKTKFQEAEAKKNTIEQQLKTANDLLFKSSAGERSKDSEIRTLKRTTARGEREINTLNKKVSQLNSELLQSRQNSIENFIYEACKSGKDIADLWLAPSRALGGFDFRGSAMREAQSKRTLVSIMTSTLKENRDVKDKLYQLQQELDDTKTEKEIRDPRELREMKQKVIDLAKQLEEARREIASPSPYPRVASTFDALAIPGGAPPYLRGAPPLPSPPPLLPLPRGAPPVGGPPRGTTRGGGGGGGHKDATITALAARCYDLGLGVQQNKEHAKELYGGISRSDLDSLVESLGYSDGASDDAFLMAEMLDFERVSFFRTGTGEKAIALYTFAAAAGHAAAQNALGNCYEMGEGVPKDLAAAEEWYAKAADQGNPLALRNLAKMHEEGLGVPRDPATASQLYAACVLAL